MNSLKQRVPIISHYEGTDGYCGGQKLYCRSKKSIKLRPSVVSVKIFPVTAPLKSVAISIFEELIRTLRGHRYILLIAESFIKFLKAIPMKGLPAVEVARKLVENCVFNYGPGMELLWTKDLQRSYSPTMDLNSRPSYLWTSDAFLTGKMRSKLHKIHKEPTSWAIQLKDPSLTMILLEYKPCDWDIYTPVHVRIQITITELNINNSLRAIAFAPSFNLLQSHTNKL